MGYGERDRAEGRTSAGGLLPKEDLVAVRSGAWRMLVPLRHVERVIPAAMPAARPSTEAARPVVAIGDELLPVVFAGALAGSDEVTLAGSHQMLLITDRGLRALLWVDAVEDIVQHAPATAPAGSSAEELVLAWSGAERTLAVLDVPRVLALAS